MKRGGVIDRDPASILDGDSLECIIPFNKTILKEKAKEFLGNGPRNYCVNIVNEGAFKMLRGRFLLFDLWMGKVIYQEAMFWEDLISKIKEDKVLYKYDVEKLRLINVAMVPDKEDKYIEAHRIDFKIVYV